MRLGPFLVIQGTFFGSIFLAVFLFWISGNFIVPAVVSSIQQQAAVISAPAQVSTQEGQVVAAPELAEGTQTCGVSQKFPPTILQWCDIIMKQSLQKGIDPDLVAAVIWQESGGDPAAYSHSGAVGLMQVMPRDGIAASFSCVNGPCFQNRPSTQELQDPEYNISYGTQMLANLQAQYLDVREALFRYGPMDVGYTYADRIMGIVSTYGN